MKCPCGGKLKRVAIDCYRCEQCGLKQKVAFAVMPIPEAAISPIVSNVAICPSIEQMQVNLQAIHAGMFKALGAPMLLNRVGR
jgi:hypothetical protein